MKTEKWNLNLLHHTTFTMAINNVAQMFDETDDYALARQTELAGFITRQDIDYLLNKLYTHDLSQKLEMTFDDILLLYTALDLSAKLTLSHQGDKKRQELKLEDNSNIDPNVQRGFEGLLQMSSVFVRNLTKEYEHVPAFKARMMELEKLNAYI